MKQAPDKSQASMAILILISIVIMTLTHQPTYAETAQAVCERPIFKQWKDQQSNRLWEPSSETLDAEKTGKVFTYNCFTEKEIDQFFENQEDRIETAHFYPILPNKHGLKADNTETEEDC